MASFADLDLKDFGEALMALRGRRSQREVARRAGLERSSVRLYETGRRRPRPETLERLLVGLEASPKELEAQRVRLRSRRIAQELVNVRGLPFAGSLDAESDPGDTAVAELLSREAPLDQFRLMVRAVAALEHIAAVLGKRLR